MPEVDKNKARQIIQRRHMARRLAVQAIYQWQIAGHLTGELLDQFKTDRDYHKTDKDYFADIISTVVSSSAEFDAVLKPYLPRDIELIDEIERAVLRIAVHELKNHQEIPYKVVINEAIGLTKQFGAEGAYKFVNGVLDKVWSKLRPLETKTQTKK